MKTYEICVVSKEYRYVTVEAETEAGAIDQAWDWIERGLTSDTKPQDYDTEVYLEGEVE